MVSADVVSLGREAPQVIIWLTNVCFVREKQITPKPTLTAIINGIIHVPKNRLYMSLEMKKGILPVSHRTHAL